MSQDPGTLDLRHAERSREDRETMLTAKSKHPYPRIESRSEICRHNRQPSPRPAVECRPYLYIILSASVEYTSLAGVEKVHSRE